MTRVGSAASAICSRPPGALRQRAHHLDDEERDALGLAHQQLEHAPVRRAAGPIIDSPSAAIVRASQPPEPQDAARP